MTDILDLSDDDLQKMSNEELKELYLKANDLQSKFNVQQNTKKILINALYGATGNKFFPLYNRDYACAITCNGRYFIQLCADNIRTRFQHLLPWDQEYIIYGDTDSVYYTVEPFVKKFETQHPDASLNDKVDFCAKIADKVVQPVIDETLDTLAKRFNVQDRSRMGAKVEVICDVMVNCAKKKYYARIRDDEGVRLPIDKPKPKILGLELAKSTTPKWVKDRISSAIPILFDKGEADLRAWLNTIKAEFTNAPLWDIAQVGSVTNLNYKLTDKGLPMLSRIVITYNNYIKKAGIENAHNSIKTHEKFKYLRLVRDNPYNTDSMAFSDKQFADKYLKKYVDYDEMFEKTFLSSLSLMCECMGYNLFQNVVSIEDEW